MVAIEEEISQKIKNAHDEVEPLIIDMIESSNVSTCPFRMMRTANPDSKETKEAVAMLTRMLYKQGLLEKLGISLSGDQAFNILLYAYGYWGGRTLRKHGSRICKCSDKCY